MNIYRVTLSNAQDNHILAYHQTIKGAYQTLKKELNLMWELTRMYGIREGAPKGTYDLFVRQTKGRIQKVEVGE